MNRNFLYWIAIFVFAAAVLGAANYGAYFIQGTYLFASGQQPFSIGRVFVTLGPPLVASLSIPYLVPICGLRNQVPQDKLIGKDLLFSAMAVGLTPAFGIVLLQDQLRNPKADQLVSISWFVICVSVLALFFIVNSEEKYRRPDSIVPMYNDGNIAGLMTLTFAFHGALA